MKQFYSVMALLLITATISVFGASPFGEFKVLNPVFENEDLKVVFSIGKAEGAEILALRIYNKTDRFVSILWDESLITDNNGRAVRPIHSGIKFIFADRPQVPTIIPPKSFIDDIMVPQSHIYYSDGWRVEPLSENALERYFMISYKVDEIKKTLIGTVHLSYTPPAPGFSDEELALAVLGGLLGILIAWWILSSMGL